MTTHRVVVAVDRLIGGVRRWRRAAATEAALTKLTDRELHDIGLARGQIASVAERLARG